MMGPMDMGFGGPTVFPSSATRLLSAIIHFVGASICAFCFARRLEAGEGADLYSWRGLAHVPWARWCTVLVFITSWIFEVFTGVLIHGVGLSMSDRNCDLGIIACIAFYVASKFFIYLFLSERVYIVWNAGSSLKRWQSPIFCVCAVIVGFYGAVIVLMSVFRIAERHPETNSCVIGLQATASAALLTYDLFINLWLTGLFLWPLARATLTNSRLRRVATRTFAAAFVALTTSTTNIVILAIFHGKESGWICLASCGADVTINALVLFWVTGSHESSHDSAVGGLRTINGLTSGRLNSKAQAFDLENGAYVDKLTALPTRSHTVWRLRSPSLESWEAAGAGAGADAGPPASIYSTLTDVLPAPTRPASMGPSVVDHESAVQSRRGASKQPRDPDYACESDDSDLDVDSAELEFATTQSAEHAHHAERELEQKRSRDALGAVTKAHGRRGRPCNCAAPSINGERLGCGGSTPGLTEVQVLEPAVMSQRTTLAADVVRSVATEPQSHPGSHSPPRAGPLSQALASFARGTKRIRTVVASGSKASLSKESSPATSQTRSGSSMSAMQFAEPQESEDVIPPLHEDAPVARVRGTSSTIFGTFPPRNQRRVPLRLSMASKRTTTTLAETDEVELGRLSDDEEEDGLWSYAPSLTPTHARSSTMDDLRERPPSIQSAQSGFMTPHPYATPVASPGFVADSPTRPLMKPSPDSPLPSSTVSSVQHRPADLPFPRT